MAFTDLSPSNFSGDGGPNEIYLGQVVRKLGYASEVRLGSMYS